MIDRSRYLGRLVESMWDGQVKVVTGIRRCGKSVLLFDIFKQHLVDSGVPEDHIIGFKLDQRRDARYRNPILLCDEVERRLDQSEPGDEHYLFVDEVQLSHLVADPDDPATEIDAYDMLNELNGYPNLDVYVTGSNSGMLSKDVGTRFRGRATDIHMHPLSFAEFHGASGRDPRDDFDTFMVYGGMPHLSSLGTERRKREYLTDLFKEVYIRDIVERFDIERPDVMEDMLDFLGSQVGSLTNANNITNALNSMKGAGVSGTTVSNYLRYLQDAFLVREVKRYDIKGKRYFGYPNKYYFEDIGLRNARLNFRQIDPGHIMECIVYNELISRGMSVDVGVVEDRRGGDWAQCEIDFVVNGAGGRTYIQSAYEMTDPGKVEAEVRSLKLTGDFFRKVVLRRDIPGSFVDDNGFLHCNIIDFLLDEAILGL